MENWKQEDVILGKYRVRHILGRGKCGDSYLIDHLFWDRSLRLKKFSSQYLQNSPLKWKHFLQRWIAFPGVFNIVNAYYLEEIAGHVCFITEYAEGKNLCAHRDDGGLRELSHILHVAIQVTQALCDASRARLFHYDLSFDNIFITAQGYVQLSDFFFQNGSHFLHYGNFLHEICYGELPTLDADGKVLFAEENTNIPGAMRQLIQSCLEWRGIENAFAFFQKAVAQLKDIYHSCRGSVYLFPVCPAHFRVELSTKQAISYIETGLSSLAAHLWKTAMDQTPASASAAWNWHLWHLQRESKTLKQLLAEVASFQDRDLPRIFCAKARLSLQIGILSEEILEELSELKPHLKTSADLLRVEGELLFRLRRYSQAAEVFTQLLSLEQEGDDWYRLAAAHFEAGNYEEAIETWERGYDERPGHILLGIGKAVCHYWRDEWQQAQDLLEQLASREFFQTSWPTLHLAEFLSGQGVYQRETTSDEKQKAKGYFSQFLRNRPQLTRGIRGSYRCSGGKNDIGSSESREVHGWSQVKKLVGQQSLVTSLAMTSDGKFACSGDSNGQIVCWDLYQERCISSLSGHTKHISSLAITPDGQRIASASWDRSVRLWEASSGNCLAVLEGHEDKVSSVAISADGHWIVSGGWDGKARVWETESQAQLYLYEMDGWINDVAIDAAGQYVICCSDTGKMSIWELANGEMIATVEGFSVIVAASNRLVSSSEDSFDLWQLPTVKHLQKIPTKNRETCLGLTEDNLFLLSKNDDDILKIWYVPGGQCVCALHAQDALCGAITEDGKTLLSSNDEYLYLWENIYERPFPLLVSSTYLHPMRSYFHTPELVAQKIRDAEIAFAENRPKDGNAAYRFVQKMPGYEKDPGIVSQIAFYNTRVGYSPGGLRRITLAREIICPHPVHAAAVSIEANLGLLASEDRPIELWNLQNNYCIGKFAGHRRRITKVAISQDGQWGVAGGWDKSVRWWNLDTGECLFEFANHPALITDLVISQDGQIGISGDKKGNLHFFDISRGVCDAQQLSQGVDRIALDASGERALVAGVDGTISLWNVDSREVVAEIRPHHRRTTAIALSHDGKYFVSSSRSGGFLMHQTNTMSPVCEIHTEDILTQLHLVSGNRIAISTSEYGDLEFWDLARAKRIYEMDTQQRHIHSMAVTPEERYIVTCGCEDGALLFEVDWEWQAVE